MVLELAPFTDIKAVQIAIGLGLVIFGHIFSSKISSLISSQAGKTDSIGGKTKRSIRQKSKYITYLLDIGFTVAALIIVNATAASQVYTNLVSLIPQLSTALLLFILGAVTINLSTVVARNFVDRTGTRRYLKDIGVTSQSIKLGTWVVKGFLYVGLTQIVLSSIGIGNTIFSPLVTAFSYAIALLLAGLTFYGFKDLLGNLSSGIYLKNASIAKPGEEVRLGEHRGRIKNISLFSTTIETDDGYTVLTPNKRIADSQLKFKRNKRDIKALEDLRARFASKTEGLSLEACAEMSLAVLGFDKDQERIHRKMKEYEKENDLKSLASAAEELTNKEIRSACVEGRRVSDIGRETKTWFSNGALSIIKFSKKEVFPESEREEEYAFVASVEESDEILLIELSAESSNGVYYVKQDNLEAAIKSEGLGYCLLAKEDTTASWRIDNDLLYSDLSEYQSLSQNLELRLTRILRKGRVISTVMAPKLEEYIRSENRLDFNS